MKKTRAMALLALKDRLTQIDSAPLRTIQTAKVWIGLAASTLFFSWCGYQLGDRYGLLVGFFSAMTLNSLVFFYADWRITELFAGTELEGQDPWGLLRMVREQSRRLGVPMPTLHLLQVDAPAAFSAGLFSKGARLFLTEGLVKRFSPDEIALVTAYELQRLKDDRTQRATAAAGLASLIAMIANAFDAVLWLPLRRENRQLRRLGPMTLLTSPAIALLVRLAVGRSGIMATDRSLGQTPALAETWAHTLIKLDAYSKTLPLDVNLADSSLFTVNPLARHKWCRFASVQPSVKTRVTALTGRFPL
jgi:heat shock protein HtpX